MFKLMASLAVCGFLLGVSSAGAATNDQGPNKEVGRAHRTHSKPAAGRSHDDLQSFLRSLSKASVPYCESDCCWAAGCDEVECTASSCYAACGDDWAYYECAES